MREEEQRKSKSKRRDKKELKNNMQITGKEKEKDNGIKIFSHCIVQIIILVLDTSNDNTNE